MKTINIMVVDDQNLVRLGLVSMLEDVDNFSIVGEAESGEQAEILVKKLSDGGAELSVILMDLRMPGIGGLEATRRINLHYPEVKIIAVTGCDGQPFPQRFMEGGASGFLTKDAGIDEVILAINTVCEGESYISQSVAQEMALQVTRQHLEVRDEGSPFERLSKRELQTALMILNGKKLSVIAVELSVSPKSVSTFRYRLLDKLAIKTDIELFSLATRYGLLEANEYKA